MSTLILDKVLSGYNLAKVNDNFERIEKAFNEALLHRDGSKELLDDLDVNSQKLLNVGGIEIGGVDIVESIASLQEEYNAYISTMNEYKSAVDEILEEAISYGAVDQKSIGNAQRVFTTSQTYAVNSNMTLPLPYIVGKNTLKLNLGHYYELYKGVDYEEVGVVGNQSTTIKLLRAISSGVEIEEFVDGNNDLYSIYSTAEALQELLTTSYSPKSIEEFVNSVSDIQELGLEDKIAQLNSLYESLVSLKTDLQTTVADINTKYSTITDMYEDVGTKYSLLETLYPQLLALLADTDFDLDKLNDAVGELNDAISDLNDLVPTIEGYKDDAETAATSAESSASSAATSATSAANSASSIAGALTNAQIWAEGTDGQVENIGGEHSAKGWAEQAKDYAVDAIETALGYTPADDSAVVKHSAQSLTNAQKTQARTNIGAQAALTTAQANAVNSGITSSKVSTYDGYASTIAGKQNTLTFDSTPTANSTNPVTSSGVKTAVDGKADDSTVVKHTAQTLTDTQKNQARTNIGALGYTVSQVVNFHRGIRGLNVQGQTDDANNWYGNSGYEQIYYNNGLTGADNISNLPKQAPFILISRTARSNSNPRTTHQTCYTDGEVYSRTYKNGTWENWKIIDGFGYIPADNDDLTAEVTARQNADSTLSSSISSEVTTRQNADAALQAAVDGKVSKSGDTMAGSLKTAVSEFIQRTVDNLYNRFCGGTAYDKGASLTLFGKDHSSQAGEIVQRAYDGTDAAVSQITPSGQFNFQNLPIENRSCYVGQSGNGTASPWFKVGSFTTTSASSANLIALLEIESILEVEKRYGLLHVKMRLNSNHNPDASRTFLEWGNAVNINPDDFVLLLNSDSTTSYFDLYVRCPKTNLRYVFKVLSEKSSLTGSSNSQSRVFTLVNNISTGSLASLPSGTQIKSKFKNKVKCGKRIVFSTDFKCPDYDELMAKTYQQGATNRYIWPQAANRFVKNGVEYLFVFSGCTTSIGTGEPNFRIITVYNLNTGEYLGYFLITGTRVTEGFVVKSESDGDYIYIASSNNTLVKGKFNLTQFKTTITTSPVLDGDGNTIPAYWFTSYLNGTWCIDGVANRVGGFTSRTLFFYDDNFKCIGQYDVQKYEQDVWSSYEGLTAEQQKIQWSIPRTQAISIGTDGIYFYKGGGTNAADTTFPITDCGVDHYNFQGDLVRSSVCSHTPFATRMLSLLGASSDINHTECEGGYCTDDGKCFWFAVVGAQSGKLVLMEEFSDAPDAIEFSDCLVNRKSNIPFQSNRPSFPHGAGSKISNPWTGEQITSIDEFIKMCAIWGLDDVFVSNYSAGLGTTIYNIDVAATEAFALHVRRYSYNRFFVEVIQNSIRIPRTYVVGLDNNFNVTSCTIQRTFNDGAVVTIVDSGTGYKRYSDGTQECWGNVKNTAATGTAVTFAKEFSARPTIIVNIDHNADASGTYQVIAQQGSTTGFTAKCAYNNAATANGICFSYYARGKWSA